MTKTIIVKMVMYMLFSCSFCSNKIEAKNEKELLNKGWYAMFLLPDKDKVNTPPLKVYCCPKCEKILHKFSEAESKGEVKVEILD